MTEAFSRFSSRLPLIVLARPAGGDQDWQEIDRGPGYFSIPAGDEIRVRIKSIDDETLGELVADLQGLSTLRFLDLSENRNITNEGMARLRPLTQLTGLNLSSCSITDTGLAYLRDLPRVEYLNLAYCNRLSDPALKTLEAMRYLTYVDLQGCLGITRAALSRVRRKNLTIYRG